MYGFVEKNEVFGEGSFRALPARSLDSPQRHGVTEPERIGRGCTQMDADRQRRIATTQRQDGTADIFLTSIAFKHGRNVGSQICVFLGGKGRSGSRDCDSNETPWHNADGKKEDAETARLVSVLEIDGEMFDRNAREN
jgi:hypothetical protein